MVHSEGKQKLVGDCTAGARRRIIDRDTCRFTRTLSLPSADFFDCRHVATEHIGVGYVPMNVVKCWLDVNTPSIVGCCQDSIFFGQS